MHVQSKLLSHTFVVDASSDLGQSYSPMLFLCQYFNLPVFSCAMDNINLKGGISAFQDFNSKNF